MEHAIEKLSLILATLTRELTHASFLSVNKVTLILDLVIVPILSALSMLLVLLPKSFIQTSLGITKGSLSICHAILPLSLINVSICVRHPTISFELPIESLSLIHCPVGVLYCAYSSPLFLISCFLIWLFPLTEVRPTLAYIFMIIIPNKSFIL